MKQNTTYEFPVRSIKDLIFWQFSNIVAATTGPWAPEPVDAATRYHALHSGGLSWGATITDFIRENSLAHLCIYCGSESSLTKEYIYPVSKGGQKFPDNVAWACQICTHDKGDKLFYEWRRPDPSDPFFRIAESRYLKYLFWCHEKKGTLDQDDARALCSHCDLPQKCRENNSVEQLTVYCLEGSLVR